MATCEITDCDSPAVGQALCRKHYMRKRRKGSTDDSRKNAAKHLECSEEGCEGEAVGRGLCERHYRPVIRGEARDKAREGRTCMECAKPLPITLRLGSTFCASACKASYQNRLRRGLTREAYDAMFSAQGSACACCGVSGVRAGRWEIDHDHSTGEVRGILCQNCNSMLGQAKDDIEVLEAAWLLLIDRWWPSREPEGCHFCGAAEPNRRGWVRRGPATLCGRCSMLLAHAGDSADVVRAGIAYLSGDRAAV